MSPPVRLARLLAPLALALAPLPAGQAAAQPAAAAAAAAAVPVPPGIDPAAFAVAREVVALGDSRRTMAGVMGPQLAEMRSGAALTKALKSNPAIAGAVVLAEARNPAAWAAATRRIGARQADILEAQAEAFIPDLDRVSAELYANNATADELPAILASQRSPVGAKLLERTPAIAAAALGQTMEQLGPKLEANLRATMPMIEQELRPLLDPKSAQ